MSHRVKTGPILAALALCAASLASHGETISKSNGIISYTANEYGVPMVSTISVLGTVLMPYDNIGAGFQVTGRRGGWNGYAFRQAGDCTQTPSQLLGILHGWSGTNLGTAAANSTLIAVHPRMYTESGCFNPSTALGYIFSFDVTLGDGLALPKEAMVADIYMTNQDGTGGISKALSDIPAISPLTQMLPLAYISADGVNFAPMNRNVNGVPTNDMRSWPYGPTPDDAWGTGKAIMLCSTGQALCLSLYSHKTVFINASHVRGTKYELSYLRMSDVYSTSDTNIYILDTLTHHTRKILAVGNPETIRSVISIAEQVVSDWGDM